MNWIGGARNRVKFQNERKTQKDFFERRRLNLSRFPSFSTQSWPKKRKLSQDLMALHTVCTFHSRAPSPGPVQRQVKSVDLDKFKSCTQHFQEVDMGPVSPTHTPSKLILVDCRGDNEKQTAKKGTSSCTTNNNQSTITSEFSSKQGSENTILETKERGEKWIKPEKGLFSFRKQDASKERYASQNHQFDPFVSEDFQCTPLVSYGTKKPKKHSRQYEKSRLETQNHLANPISKDQRIVKSSAKFSYTSTPYNKMTDCSGKTKGPFKQVLDFDVSPIIRVRHNSNQNEVHRDSDHLTKMLKPRHPTHQNNADLHDTWKTLGVENVQIDSGWDKSDMNNESHKQYRPKIICYQEANKQARRSINSLKRRLYVGDTPECSLGYKSDSDKSVTSLKLSDSSFALFQRENSLSIEIPANIKSELHESLSDRSVDSESVKSASEAGCKLLAKKPNLDDFDEEFKFTPNKDVCSFSKVTRKEPNILSLYAELDEKSDTRKFKLSRKIRSLETGEQIQSHPQKNKSAGTNSSDVDRTAEELVGKQKSGKAIAHQREMNDILQEMNQLEEDEKSMKKRSQELLQTSVNVAKPPDPIKGSESFEADRFLESGQNEILIDIPQLTVDVEEPGKTFTESEYIAVPLNSTCTFTPHAYIHVDENYCDIKQKADANNNYSENATEKKEFPRMTEYSGVMENGRDVEEGENCGKKEVFISEFAAVANANKAGENLNIGVKVQDPEVSSGKNRGVQCIIRQHLVDRGTSPVIFNSSREYINTGTQCDKTYVDVGSQCD